MLLCHQTSARFRHLNPTSRYYYLSISQLPHRNLAIHHPAAFQPRPTFLFSCCRHLVLPILFRNLSFSRNIPYRIDMINHISVHITPAFASWTLRVLVYLTGSPTRTCRRSSSFEVSNYQMSSDPYFWLYPAIILNSRRSQDWPLWFSRWCFCSPCIASITTCR